MMYPTGFPSSSSLSLREKPKRFVEHCPLDWNHSQSFVSSQYKLHYPGRDSLRSTGSGLESTNSNYVGGGLFNRITIRDIPLCRADIPHLSILILRFTGSMLFLRIQSFFGNKSESPPTQNEHRGGVKGWECQRILLGHQVSLNRAIDWLLMDAIY